MAGSIRGYCLPMGNTIIVRCVAVYGCLTAGTTLNVPGLTEATNYIFRVRTFCNTTRGSNRTSIAFFTPINCSNKPIIYDVALHQALFPLPGRVFGIRMAAALLRQTQARKDSSVLLRRKPDCIPFKQSVAVALKILM